jgi:hypothetical protein
VTPGASAAIALSVTALVCPVLVGALRRLQIVDTPTSRSSHEGATPRGGGVAVAAGALAGLALASPMDLRWRTALLDLAYQRLVIAGWSHSRTTMLVAALSAVCSVLGAATLTGAPALAATAGLALVGVLASSLWAPVLVRRQLASPVPAT